jgi:iron complex outermembrane recepter protein
VHQKNNIRVTVMLSHRVYQSFVHALLGSTMISGAICAAPALAADPAAPTAAPVNDEIIVTAQKREENLQKVPISIVALTSKKLSQLKIANFNDYTKQLPSVSFQTSQPGVTNVYIRGVASGGDGNHSGPLPSVGVYLDEQPVTTIGGTLDVHIYDIARIEVLSGPQGTLYGASSEAGTIRIISNKPTTAGFSGSANAELNTVSKGSVGGKLEGYVNVPVSENAAVRVVGWYQHDAGFIDNVAGTRSFLPRPGGFTINNAKFVKKNYNDVDVAGGRAALKIDLNDNWTATAALFGQDQRNHGAFGYDAKVGDLKVQHFFPEFYHDRFAQAALTIEGKIGNWDLTYAGAYLKRKINSQNDYTDYAEAYDSLYASYGGNAGYFYFQDNAGNTIVPTQTIVGRDKFGKLSQELRIASPADLPIRFVGGLFYQRQSHLIHQDYQVPGLGAQVSVNGVPGTIWLTQQNRVDKDYAAFGEVSYDVVENVTLTGGLRGYKYDNSLIGFFGFGRNPAGQPFNAAGSSRTGVAGCYTTTGATLRDNPGGTLLPAAVPGGPCTNLGVVSGGKVIPKSTKGDGITYRLNATWRITPEQMVYATWSKGFRPGGINRRSTIAPYAEDTLINYELGLKSTLADGAVRINAAAFMQDWKSFQFAFLGQNSFTEIHNGPNARIKGVEVELNWTAADGLTFSGSAAYTDAKTRANLCAADDATFACTSGGNFISAPKGTRLPVTPRFKANGTARYEFAAADGKAHVQATVSHSSSAASDIRTLIAIPNGGTANPAALTGRLASSTVADFAVGIDWERYSAELFVSNAFDERVQLSRGQECGVCFQRPYIVTNTPRTIGVRVGTKF